MKKVLLFILGLAGLALSLTTPKTYAINTMSAIPELPNKQYIQSFKDLPRTAGTLENASLTPSSVGAVYFQETSKDLFTVFINYANTQYYLTNVVVPGVKELNRVPLQGGIYWHEAGESWLYYEFQDRTSKNPINENIFIDGEVSGFRPSVMWNATTGKADITEKLRLLGYGNIKPGDQVFVDVLFPIKLDDLLSITFDYNIVQHKMFGMSKTESNILQTRYRGEMVDPTSSWTKFVNSLPKYNGLISVPGQLVSRTEFEKTITDITRSYSSQSKKETFLTAINKALKDDKKPTYKLDELFGKEYSVYQIYLGTHWTMGQTMLELKNDHAVVDLLYQYKGEYFHLGEESMDYDGSGATSQLPGDMLPGFLKFFEDLYNSIMKFVDFIAKNSQTLAIIVGIILVVIFGVPAIGLAILIFKLVVGIFKLFFKLIQSFIKLATWLVIPKKKKGGKKT